MTPEERQQFTELKNRVDTLQKSIDDYKNPATISEEFLQTLIRKGFLRKSLYLTYEGSSGMVFDTVFVDYENRTTALTGFDKSYYIKFTAETSDTCTAPNHGLADSTPVYVVSTGTIPAGLSPLTQYYIINSATNTFKLSLSAGGAAVNITSAGVGAHYLLPQP